MSVKQSKLCTVGFVFGIVGLCTSIIAGMGVLPSIVGLILSIICLAKKLQPKSKAVKGLVLSICGCVVGVIVAIVSFILFCVIIAYSQVLGIGTQNSLVENTAWIAEQDGSRMVFEEYCKLNWYLDPSVTDDNYIYGDYAFYYGEDAYDFLKNDIMAGHSNQNNIDSIFNTSERTVDNMVCISINQKSVILDGAERLKGEQMNYYYGFMFEDGTYMQIMNLTTSTVYDFVKE